MCYMDKHKGDISWSKIGSLANMYIFSEHPGGETMERIAAVGLIVGSRTAHGGCLL